MSGVKVKYKVTFEGASKPVTTPLARRLALAHAIDRLVGCGVLRSYAEAAKILKITRASLTATLGLQRLSPRLQEAVLQGAVTITKPQLLPVQQHAIWGDQRREVERLRRDENNRPPPYISLRFQ